MTAQLPDLDLMFDASSCAVYKKKKKTKSKCLWAKRAKSENVLKSEMDVSLGLLPNVMITETFGTG